MKRTIFVTALIFSTFFTFSQSILWKVTGPGLAGTSYLYGSIHIQDARVFAYDSTIVIGALKSCDAFAMEVLLDEVNPHEMVKSMYMPKGKVLSKMMSKEDFAKLDSVCRKTLGIGAVMMNAMKPFFVSGAIQEASFSRDTEDALDLYLLKRARAMQKSCYGVETFQTQIDAIDAISLKDQVKMLVDGLNSDNADTSASNESEEMLQAYLDFDLNKIFEMSNDPSMPKKFNKIFLIDRNVGMAEHFEELAQKQSLFCAVGAGHLPGAKGVIELLRKKGYTIEPVIFQWQPIDK